MKPDLVIRGGTIVDGSGAPPYGADVVVEGGRIAGVGRHDGPAGEVIDARGKIVTPGFIDIHTHLDAQLAWDPLGSPSSSHGVTSVIVGNCGVGFAPCKPKDRDYLMFLMEGVEDIPRASMAAGIPWQWESFPEYLDFLGRQKLGLNVGAHISHAPLRIWAMGERGATDTPATDEELAAMHGAVTGAMRAGALGFATGRTTMHRTPAWDPVPGTFADRRELDALAGALADVGTGVFEIVPYGGAGEDSRGFLREIEWMPDVSRAMGRPISVCLIQNLKYPEVWKETLGLIEGAVKQGARLVPQVAVRSVGILLGCETLSPLMLFPAAGELIGKPIAELRQALRDAALRARMVESMQHASGEILGGMATIDDIYPLEGERGVFAYETKPEKTVTAIARRLGKEPGEVILDHLLATDLKGFFIVPLYNHDLDAAGAMLAHPLTTIGLGDAGAHTSQTSDAGFATFMLAYWVRERKLMPLERAVRKLTFDPALQWSIPGRGLIRRGWHADLNVIDLDRLDLLAPELKHEFPAGAKHLSQGAIGYDATIVNGKVMMRDGAHSGALPGVVLRNEMVAF